MSNAKQLIDLLAKKGLTLGSVESFTGGLFAKTITDVSGASQVFKGSLVTYSKELKIKLLGMDEEFINENGLVSWGVAQDMAIKGRRVLGVDVCVSFTGNAGPEVLPGEAGVGEVYMAIVYGNKIWSIPLKLELEREKVRQQSVDAIIGALISILGK
ncbi:MAG: CinA family protein [Candidatus Onthovivens sp.]|nr:CinA family protein [Candidatus Onthovivens sp.]